MNPNLPTDRLVFILSGLSGAGKTYMAEKKVAVNANHGVKTTRISTNDWFRRPDGSWKFDPELLPEYHELAFADYVAALDVADPVVIVDNTNIFQKHRRPYEQEAAARRYTCVNVVVGMFDPDFVSFCAARTQHGVDLAYIGLMARKYELPATSWTGDVLRVTREECGWTPDWRKSSKFLSTEGGV